MRKVYLLPNIITAFGLACGLFVILKINMIEPGEGTYQVLYSSTLLLLLAALADVLDGAIARVFRVESDFGAVFDCLADAISFGIAPSVLMLKSLSLEQGTLLSFFAITGAMLFSICGVLRLVRFSIKSQEAKNDEVKAMAHKKHFTGLPIPAAAMAVVSTNLLLSSPLITSHWEISETVRAAILISVTAILGYFMVSRWKFPSVKTLHFRIPSFQLVCVTVLFAFCVLYGTLYFLPALLFAITWSYILLGWSLSIIRLIAGKKSKTLADFEPDTDELDEIPE
jgi:CDP-diacylglycerol---serine O-phosphatidyltransferase